MTALALPAPLSWPAPLAARTPVAAQSRGDAVRSAPDAEDIREVERFLAGDERGFEVLFDRYRDKVYHVAYRYVRNKEDALEVTQEVFLRVYQNIARFKTNSKFFTWLYRIAVNRAIDFTRSRKARPLKEIDSFTLENREAASPARRAEIDPVERAQHGELEEKLAAAVERLSESHRTVFLLHAREQLSYREIAEVVECSIGTVMSRLFYARKKLQEALGSLGIERPGRATRTAKEGE
jgi:RNA polymerase sigma-70 factor (ECF subfamily)